MLKKILIALAVLLVVFLIIVALRPDTYRIERSLAISAPPAEIFAQVNDFQKAQVWSPWVKLDPAGKYTFEGPPAGIGAVNTWAGNSNIGAGRQTITESRPNELVRIRLDFLKPMAGTATAEFTLKPQGGQTVVTWSMFGENNFLAKAVCIFMNQDKMIGDQFAKGLADLKTLTEAAAKK